MKKPQTETPSEPQKRLRIVVGTNSLVNTQYEAYTNHCQFWFRLGRLYPHIDFIFVNPSRMSIDRMRNLCAQTALENEADYLLFLDDDVLIPHPFDALGKLLACNADIAAAKVVIRGFPFDWMIFKRKGPKGTIHLFPCKKLPNSGVEKCDAVGFSFCLIKTSLLKKVEAPYFVTGMNNTEDIYFCVKATLAEPKIKIVCECSIACGHILWPEVMNTGNREAYSEYFKKLNPYVVEKKDSPDRGGEYLKEVESAVS